MYSATYVCNPRDLLFFRDGRPMDIDKSRGENIRNIGHGAYWPRPDHLFSAFIHHLIEDASESELNWYHKVQDLNILGPFPFVKAEDTIYLPFPLDWDMKIEKLPEGMTNIPKPLTHGFCNRTPEKKSLPTWISYQHYMDYLEGKDKNKAAPSQPKLYQVEPRIGTTLDPNTGASKRVKDPKKSGQYHAEYLRLMQDVSMLCLVEQSKRDILGGETIRIGGQGGMVDVYPLKKNLKDELARLPRAKATKYVRWTLITPALFNKGWYPNWLNAEGRVMIPQNEVLRRPGEKREAFRKRKQEESVFFETAHLIAARIGSPLHFSGWDSLEGIKPTELIVPAGSSYIFECRDEQEAEKLIEVLSLRPLSDLGQKGFGFGLCSYVSVAN